MVASVTKPSRSASRVIIAGMTTRLGISTAPICFVEKSALTRRGNPLYVHPRSAHTSDPAGNRRFGVVAFQEGTVRKAGDRCTDDRRDPEQPQLMHSPAADENRGPGAARRIYRSVRDGDADEVD